MDIRIKCPGQDAREFDPEGVCEHPCPRCGREVEFFPEDRSRKCPACGARFRNPQLDIGCAEWCRFAKECLDFAPAEGGRTRQRPTLVGRGAPGEECAPGPAQGEGVREDAEEGSGE
ncbi:MAG: TFIIB-type zinc ribbon-containing protein [Planctomycetota bacterium]|jgi:hypothetical protein